MDIQLLGAWGEFIGGISGLVGAVAVVATLIFVGLQVRTNTETLRVAARQSMQESVQRNGLIITENAEFANIVYRASREEDVTAIEKLRLFQYLRSYCQSAALYHYFASQGLITEQHHQRQLEVLVKTVLQPYFPDFWRRFRDEFEPEFSAVIEGLLRPAGQKRQP